MARSVVAMALALMLAFSGAPAVAPAAHADAGEGSSESAWSAEAVIAEGGAGAEGAEGEQAPIDSPSAGSSSSDSPYSDSPNAADIVTIIVQLETAGEGGADDLGVQSSDDWQATHERYKSMVRDLAVECAGAGAGVDAEPSMGAGAKPGAGAGGWLASALRTMGLGEPESDSAPVEELYDYHNAFDGFAVKAPAGVLDSVRVIDGVKRAFIERSFDVDDSLPIAGSDLSGQIPMAFPTAEAGDDEPANQSSLAMTGANQVSQKGDGQLIAILDSGFDTAHDAFKGEIDTTRVAWSGETARARRADCLQGGREAAYISPKVPFAYDYGDGDANVVPSNGALDHGMHVAGIAAANGGETRGVAPAAQLALLKVANDLRGSIYESSLMAALDDAVALRPDVLSMSLGSDGGFSAAESSLFGEVFDTLEDQGCIVCVSAGNSYTSAQNNASTRSLSFASDPDQGITSGPASLSSALAVGSLENSRDLPYFMAADGRKICYLDGDRGDLTGAVFADVAEGEYEYVDAGYGTQEECAALRAEYGSLRGKIAIVEDRDVWSAAGLYVMSGNRVSNIADLRPAAIIMYNTGKGSLDAKNVGSCTRPVACVVHEDGVALREASVRTVTVRHGLTLPPSSDYVVNAFSSWGTTPEMALKPELAAPGGNIYSSILNNKYGYKSGTSMATPQVAGLSALMREYVEGDAKFSGMDDAQRHDVVRQLLMCTARPLNDSNADAGCYSPRQQGAGSADVRAAMATPVFLTVDGATDPAYPKAELGESEDGVWSFSMTLHNLGDDDRTFKPDVAALCEGVSDGLFQQVSEDYAGDGVDVSYSGDAYDATLGTVRVAAGSTSSYTISIACEDGFGDRFAEAENGMFVEGFARLEAQDIDGVDLSVPYLGFYGDWSKAPVFDARFGSEESPHLYGSRLVNANTERVLGANPLGEGAADDADLDKAVVSIVDSPQAPNTLQPRIGALRGARRLTFSYVDSSMRTVRSFSYDFVGKCEKEHPYLDNTFLYPLPEFTGTDDQGMRLPDGSYALVVRAETAGPSPETQSCRFDFTLDTTPPVFLDRGQSDDGSEVRFTVVEGNFLAGVDFLVPGSDERFYRVLADDVEPTVNADGSKAYSFSVPRAELRDAWVDAGNDAASFPADIELIAWDYGMNSARADVLAQGSEFEIGADGELLGYHGVSTIVDIPGTVTSIAARAFAGSSVMAVSIPSSVRAIGDEAFLGAEKLRQVAFAGSDDEPSQLSSIGLAAFSGAGVTSIVLPNGVTSLGADAFADSALEFAILPETLTALPENAFANSNLERVVVSSSLTAIGKGAFSGCAALSRIGCAADAPDVRRLPASVKAIGERAFESCGLGSLSLPEGLASIGTLAFANSSLRHLEVPGSVSLLEPRALSDMGKLTALTLGSQMTPEQVLSSVSGDAALKNIYVSGEESRLTSIDGVLFANGGTTLIMFPFGRAGAYVVPTPVREIGPSAFRGAFISSVILPAGGGVVIGESAFEDSDIESILLAGALEIGESAFANCARLTEVDFTLASPGLTTIGQNAFSPGTPLRTVALPDCVTDVGSKAFANNAALERVRLGAGVRGSFGDIFSGCDNIADIEVSPDNEAFETDGAVLYAKDGDELRLVRSLPVGGLTSYAVKAGTVGIETRAFSDNTTLEKVTLPEGLTHIGSAAFAGCGALEDVKFPDSLETVTGFQGTAISFAEFGTKVREIKSSAFTGHNPSYIVVRGGQDGSYASSLESGDDARPIKGAYFGEGMARADFSASAIVPPNVIVVPRTMVSLKLNAPSANVPYEAESVTVYALRDSAGWKAAKAALDSIGADSSVQLKELQTLSVSASVQLVEGQEGVATVEARASGGAAGYAYRFTHVAADGTETILADWDGGSTCEWDAAAGASLRCEVRDASGFTASTLVDLGSADGPAQPGSRDDPVRPDQPDEPEQPDSPGQTDEPGQPEEPDVPAQPERPDGPGRQEEPDQPDQPTQPEEPASPEEPSRSSQYQLSNEVAQTGSQDQQARQEQAGSPLVGAEQETAQEVKVGQLKKVSGQMYKVFKVATSTRAGAVGLVKAKSAKAVVIPATVKLPDGNVYKVTRVESGAFKGNAAASVKLGKNVRTIASGAFRSASNLKSAKLGGGVLKLAKGAFKGAGKLVKVTLSSTRLVSKKTVAGAFQGSSVQAVTLKGMSSKRKAAVASAIRKWGGKDLAIK